MTASTFLQRITFLSAAVALSVAPAAQRAELPWQRFTWFGARLGDEHIARLALLVPVTLAGVSGAHHLQLDTGASQTVLHGGALQELSPELPPPGASMSVSGSMAGVTVMNERVSVIPDFRATLGDGVPMPIIGSLGLSFFADRLLVLDYPGARFMVLPRDAPLPPDIERRAEFVPATLRNGKLYLPVTLDGDPRDDIFFDTGASAFALITSPARWRALTGLQGTEASNLSRTVPSWDTKLPLVGSKMKGRLSVGRASLREPVVWHTADPRFSFSAWPDTSGFIGNEVFADRFVAILDLPRGRFGLAISASVTPPAAP